MKNEGMAWPGKLLFVPLANDVVTKSVSEGAAKQIYLAAADGATDSDGNGTTVLIRGGSFFFK